MAQHIETQQAKAHHVLTDRQKREQAFYERYSEYKPVQHVEIAVFHGTAARPWNSYWYSRQRTCALRDQYGRRLLEFGCGQGADAVGYALAGFDVDAFDITPANIEQCYILARKYNVSDKVRFTVQSAEHLDYNDGCFDVVAGTNILHHCDVPTAVDECFRVLRPGGFAVFREHVEVPVLEFIRLLPPITWIWPRIPSLEHHITEDETNLSGRDIDYLRTKFDHVNLVRFGFLSRLRRIIPKWNRRLSRLDQSLFRTIPWSQSLGMDVVIELQKL